MTGTQSGNGSSIRISSAWVAAFGAALAIAGVVGSGITFILSRDSRLVKIEGETSQNANQIADHEHRMRQVETTVSLTANNQSRILKLIDEFELSRKETQEWRVKMQEETFGRLSRIETLLKERHKTGVTP